ncbi:hypothetical protein L218DRAFT_1071438 [Marasmius fiardii PR-910]|nr:hypothetical protein L218DRAFT_1071438 [Marasmius fiardii PR-910]
MSRASINLPLATHPTKPTQDLEQNLVLLQSLRQSREKWISSAFPKFSSTARQSSKSSKNQIQIPNPPPHTIQSRGKCDLAIGPHIFYDTIFYEVHYLQQSTAFYASAYSSILAPNLSPMMITPEVVNRVNSAAATNPTLANLLQLAAAGKASDGQLKTLGLLIQSLATTPPIYQIPGMAAMPQPSTVPMTYLMHMVAASSQTPITSTSSTPVPQVPVQQEHSFDVVIEFRENNTERWLLPRGIASVVCSLETPTAITVTASLPFSKSKTTSLTALTEDAEDHLIELELTNAPLAILESLRRWAGGEDRIEENRGMLNRQKSIPRETYLSYEVPEDSDLLTQLQSAIAPPNLLKSIKPSNNLHKRPSAPRKRAAKAKETTSRMTIPPQATATTPTPAPTTVTSPAPPPLEPVTPLDPSLELAAPPALTPSTTSTPVPTSTPITFSPTPSSELNPTFYAPSPVTFANNKKPRQPKKQKMKSPPPVIRCLSCGQTDVPLLLGGRFCRPCVEGGRANADIPQAPLMKSGMTHTMPAYVSLVQSLKLSPFPSSSPQSTSSSGAVSGTPPPQIAERPAAPAATVTPPAANVGSAGTGTVTDVKMVDVESGHGESS